MPTCERMPRQGGRYMHAITILASVVDPVNVVLAEAHIFRDHIQNRLVLSKIWVVNIVLQQLLDLVNFKETSKFTELQKRNATEIQITKA